MIKKFIKTLFLSILFCFNALYAAPHTTQERDVWLATPIDNSSKEFVLDSFELPWSRFAILCFGSISNLDGLPNEYEPLFELDFLDDNHYLSNCFPKEIIVDGRTYKCSEFYYQAIKFEIDGPVYNAILAAETPLEAKAIAWANASAAKLGDDQEMSRRMKKALWSKFLTAEGYPNELGQKLIATGNCEIIEGNRRLTQDGKNISDRRWGMEFDFTSLPQKVNLKGQNLLGKILMELRTILKCKSIQR